MPYRGTPSFVQHFLRTAALVLPLLAVLLGTPAFAEQSKDEDKKRRAVQGKTLKAPPPVNPEAKRLMRAIRTLLERASKQRIQAKKLPSRDDYYVAVPPWTETREDREATIREILDSALEIVTDGPIVEFQKKMKKRRKTIVSLRKQIAEMRERRLDAPESSMVPFTETISSIDEGIEEREKRIKANIREIARIKKKIKKIFKDKNIDMSDEQLDLLLGSVLGGDIVKLVAAFEAARIIDARLGKLMAQNNESLESARRYFAMHAALFAMLLHAQNEVIHKIDHQYMKRLQVIIKELRQARNRTVRLLRGQNRPDQRRILLANRKAQDFSEQVAVFYRDYLYTQRRKIIESRRRTIRDLSIADNTYETVEASFQLKTLIEDAKSSFQALERLEAPGFGQVFKNDQLRKEFQKLTDKLQAPTS